jgi:hypothetical protein
LVPELYSPIYKGVFSDICPLFSTLNFLAMITPAQIAGLVRAKYEKYESDKLHFVQAMPTFLQTLNKIMNKF